MNDLAGKVALVTDGAADIGAAISRALADAGADIAITTGASHAAAEKLAAEISGDTAVRARAYHGDISDEAIVLKMVAAVEKDFGHIDILVNNAGITRDRSFLKMTRALWDEVLGVNLNGPFNVTNAVLRNMVNLGWGRIVNLSSAGGPPSTIDPGNYTVTKGGLIAFTMTLARELARKGITVNAVSPGYTTAGQESEASETARDQIQQLIPMGRLGEPAEIAAAVAFLTSPRASYITGQVIGVNGGMSM